MTTENRRILIIDDERPILLTLEALLGRHGYDVETSGTASQGLKLLKTKSPALVLLDLQLPDAEGLQTLDEIKAEFPGTPVIILTAHDSLHNAIESIKRGAFHFISKPYAPEELLSLVEKALEKESLLRETEELRQKTQQLERRLERVETRLTPVFKSKAMQEIDELIGAMAPSEANVLITGESGTGKELVARSIHGHSDRTAKPYLAINCAAVPEALLESELFGYARGAHSTATADKPGLFELASGGTLLLDEVGDMSLTLQAKLLRVLEDSETRRLGDTRTVRTDVRLIASTNKDLARLIREEKFRSDLFYRLNVVSITLPPLRERKEDIPALVEHFIRKYNAHAHKTVADAAPEVLASFQTYTWPGNVRELENVIERAVILNSKSRIMLEDLPPLVKVPQAGGNLSLEEMERRHIVQVLQDTKGNVKAAAGVLGIDRKTLYRKAAEYGIDIVRE